MGGKRDANYYRERLRRDHPTVFAGLGDGTYRSVRAAAIKAGLIRQPGRVDALQRAWNKATAAEKKEFLDWARGKPKGSTKKIRTGADLVDANGWLTTAVSDQVRRAMAAQRLKMGDLMSELGLKRLNASVGNALHGRVRLNADTLDRLAAWLDKHRT